jgi:hypothetical protein
MDNTPIQKLIDDTKPGSHILAWPLWDSYKSKGYKYPQYLYGLFFFQDLQYKYARGVSEEEMHAGPEEVYIDLNRGEQGEYIIKVRDLTKTKPEVAERVKPVTEEFQNYIHLFIDTVSRNRFFRRYPKTVKWLQKHWHEKGEKKRVYELLRM